MTNKFFFTGALEDKRSPEQKVKDQHFREAVASASPINWVEKTNIRKFTPRNQGYAGSCVANTVAKLQEIQYFNKTGEIVPFSATSIYQYRSNKPDGGMIGVEAFDIWRKKGITTEAILRSQNVANDAEIDGIKIPSLATDTAKVFGVDGYVQTPFDIDTIASIIENTKKGVMLWFKFSNSEWSSQVPVINGTNAPARHSICGVDWTLKNGKKAIAVEDSAWFGGFNTRFITEDWFNDNRMLFSAYPLNSKFIVDDVSEIRAVFTKPLVFIPLDVLGNISDMTTHNAQQYDVIKLQDILKKEGLFPSNWDSTGYYGAKTCEAVLKFQKKYKVDTDDNLNTLAGRRVGSLTIAKLNQLYSK